MFTDLQSFTLFSFPLDFLSPKEELKFLNLRNYLSRLHMSKVSLNLE